MGPATRKAFSALRFFNFDRAFDYRFEHGKSFFSFTTDNLSDMSTAIFQKTIHACVLYLNYNTNLVVSFHIVEM